MKLVKKILKYVALYLVSLSAITTIVYLFYLFYPLKTLHLDKKQWRPAEPETQNIDKLRLTQALDYVDTRLPTARSLLMLRNGKLLAVGSRVST